MVLRSGSYTGTGSAQTINVSDIGGQIGLVIIWNEAGNYANFSVYAKNGRSYELGNDSVAQTNAITNLGTTGFTVGTNNDVNQTSDTFHYLAVRDDSAGDFSQGSYTGDGSTPRDITAPNFQPDFVLVRQDSDSAGNGYDVYRTSGVASSARFDTANITGRITALIATGFTVDNSIDTNKNAIDFAWFAFKNTANKFKTTTYTGNGSDNTGITGVGFQPDFVIVHNRTNNNLAVESDRSDSGDKTQIVRGNAATTNIIQAMQSDGFQVGTSARSNENASSFNYMAWLAAAPIITTTSTTTTTSTSTSTTTSTSTSTTTTSTSTTTTSTSTTSTSSSTTTTSTSTSTTTSTSSSTSITTTSTTTTVPYKFVVDETGTSAAMRINISV